MNIDYWKNYYSSKKAPEQPSLFARFVLKNYLKEDSTLVELGCGNGRDSLFFARHNIKVLAIDQCKEEITKLRKNNNLSNLSFRCTDFTKLRETRHWDNVYSRFTLHSISDKQETNVIKWSYASLKKDGKIFIEVRGKKNELYKLGKAVKGEADAYIYNEHYRRFTGIEDLCLKLKKNGFNILLSEEKTGFAPFNNTNYKFIRIIAKKL